MKRIVVTSTQQLHTRTNTEVLFSFYRSRFINMQWIWSWETRPITFWLSKIELEKNEIEKIYLKNCMYICGTVYILISWIEWKLKKNVKTRTGSFLGGKKNKVLNLILYGGIIMAKKHQILKMQKILIQNIFYGTQSLKNIFESLIFNYL